MKLLALMGNSHTAKTLGHFVAIDTFQQCRNTAEASAAFVLDPATPSLVAPAGRPTLGGICTVGTPRWFDSAIHCGTPFTTESCDCTLQNPSGYTLSTGTADTDAWENRPLAMSGKTCLKRYGVERHVFCLQDISSFCKNPVSSKHCTKIAVPVHRWTCRTFAKKPCAVEKKVDCCQDLYMTDTEGQVFRYGNPLQCAMYVYTSGRNTYIEFLFER